MADERKSVTTGTKYEFQLGYSRAVRLGNVIHVSGSAGFDKNGVLVSDDPVEQARRALEIVRESIEKLGGTLEDVIMTRVYIADIKDIERVGIAHGEVFREIRPASTFVKTEFIDPRILVEVEAEAILGGRQEKV